MWSFIFIMSIKGVLSTDKGMTQLNRILDVLNAFDDNFDDALTELSSFFSRHLKTNLLPISSSTKFPSPVQKQVYTWLDPIYQSFCDLLNNKIFPITQNTERCIQSLLASDSQKKLIPAAVSAFIQNDLFSKNQDINSLPEFQEAVYSKLIDITPEHQDKALQVLITEFPNPKPSKSFSNLFLKYISSQPSNDSIIQILDKFDSILSRVDDKLITYDFLHDQFESDPLLASLALPYLVNVAQSSAVDSPNFYQIAFRSISPHSLGSPHRTKYLETLISVLSPKTRPANEVTCFAVKLSRMLPLIPVDAQIDVLSVLQALVRAHECVAKLLDPIDTDIKIANVYGELEECTPQTLWEVRALRESQVPAASEEARTLGQRWVPPDFCSFKLVDAVESIKAKPKGPERPGNWSANLDQTIWNFH